MKRWKVTGTKTVRVFCVVEANDEDEAWEKAGEEFGWQEEDEEYGEYIPEIDGVEEIEE